MADTPVMQRGTQTPIAIVRDHIEAWRRDNRWSRETVSEQIVAAHLHAGYDKLTGIVFDPPTRDTYERMRVNADKLYRWLDDATKDKNLLTVNMLWTILAALPEDRRLALTTDLLAPVGLDPILIGYDLASGQDQTVIHHFRGVVESTSEAQCAMSRMVDGIDPGEPEAARAKLGKARMVIDKAVQFLLSFQHRKVARQ